MRVEAYYNLHRQCLSYRPIGGRVAHASGLVLENVTFAVQPAGRAKVLREKRKNVHAFVRGELIRELQPCSSAPIDDIELAVFFKARRVTYNPYRYESFVYEDTEEPVFSAGRVWIKGKHILVIDTA